MNHARARRVVSIRAPADQLTTISTRPKPPSTPETAPVASSAATGKTRRSREITAAASPVATICSGPLLHWVMAMHRARTTASVASPASCRRDHMRTVARRFRASRAIIFTSTRQR